MENNNKEVESKIIAALEKVRPSLQADGGDVGFVSWDEKTGVVGVLRGNVPGKTVAIRADMDALPIEEATGVPYASKIKGKKNAAGTRLRRTVKIIQQA